MFNIFLVHFLTRLLLFISFCNRILVMIFFQMFHIYYKMNNNLPYFLFLNIVIYLLKMVMIHNECPAILFHFYYYFHYCFEMVSKSALTYLSSNTHMNIYQNNLIYCHLTIQIMDIYPIYRIS